MIIEGDPEKFLTDFYSKKNNEEISQEKLDSILSIYGDNYDKLISDLYSKYDPEGLSDSKLATIKESYKLAPEESLEQKYLVNGFEVGKKGMLKRLYDDEFVERFQKGEITVDIENDSRLKAIANQQKNSGDAWSDAYESLENGASTLIQGLISAETYLSDGLELITGVENIPVAGGLISNIPKEARNSVVKNLVDRVEENELKKRATEGDFVSELSSGNFSRAAKMGLNTTLQSAPLMLASIGAAYATGGSSVIAQALAGAGTMTSLLTPAEYVQTLVSEDPNIQKLSKGEKFFRGTARGLAEGIPEGIMGPVGLSGGKILLQGLKGLVKKAGIEVGETAAKGLAKELGKETSLEIAKSFGLGTAAEGVTEFTTSLAQDLTDDFLDVQNLGFEEYLRKGLNAGALGIFMGSVVQGGGIALNSGKNTLLRNNSVKQGAVSQIRKEQELGNISKQQGNELIKQIDELQQAVDKTDSDLSNEQQEKIANLIYEKNQLNQRIKGLDPNQESVKKAKERILEIDNEISSVSETDIDVASKIVEIEEGIQELKLNKTIKFLESQGKKLGKRTYTVEDEFDADGNLIKSAGEKAQEIYDEYVKENPGTEQIDVSNEEAWKVGNIAVINKSLSKQRGAISVGSHETFHLLVDDYFEGISIKDRRKLIKDFKNLLSEQQLEVVNKRIQDAYMKIKGFDPETSIEWFTAFSDAINLDQITFDESIGNKILNFVQEIFRKLGIRKEFSNARQAYNFMKDYSKSVSKGQLSKRALKLSKTPSVSKKLGFSKTIDLTKQSNQDKLNDLVGPTNEEGFYTVSKDDFAGSQAETVAKQLIDNGAFDNLIGKKIKVTDPKQRQDILEDSKEEIKLHIERFNPSLNKNLFGYINSYIGAKVGTVAKKALKAPKTITTDKKIGGEESKTTVGETLVSDEISPEDYADIQLAKDKIKKIKPQQSKIAKKIDLTDNEINLAKRDIISFLRKTDRPGMTDPKKFFKALVDYTTGKGVQPGGFAKVIYDKLSLPRDGKLSTKNKESFIREIAEDLIALNKVDPAVMRRSKWTPFYELEIKRMNTKQTQKAIDEGRIPSTTNLEAGNDLFKTLDPSVDQVVDYLMGIRPDVLKRKMPKFLGEVIIKNEFNEIVDNPKQPVYDTKGNETDNTIDLSESITEEEVTRGVPQVREKIARPQGIKFSANSKAAAATHNLKHYDLSKSSTREDVDKYVADMRIIVEEFDKMGMSGILSKTMVKVRGKLPKNKITIEGVVYEKGLEEYLNKELSKIPGITNLKASKENNYGKSTPNQTFGGNLEVIRKKATKQKVKEFNDRNSKMFDDYWKGLNKILSKNRKLAITVYHLLQNSSIERGNPHSLGALIEAIDNVATGKAEWEHAVQNVVAYNFLFDAILDKNIDFNKAFKAVKKNYKLIAMNKVDELKVAKAGYKIKMPEGWDMYRDFWWQRYLNPQVAAVDGGIANENLKWTGEGENIFQTYDNAGNKITTNLSANIVKSKDSNIKELSNNVAKFSKSMSANEVVGYAKTVDNALANARKLDAPVKKIRVFDFDDTLATTKSDVLSTAPDGTEGKLNAEDFARDGARLLEEGYTFDFTEFNKVTKGKPGPLLDIAKKIQAARGTEDVFVLTARPPEAQVAIKEFLDSVGLNIPLENITGLGNSTGEAKANWMVEKAAEGYNDFYFADDAYQNVKAVKDAMSVLDVKSKVQQAKIKFSKSVNEDFNKIIEQTTGIGAEKIYSEAKAKVRGANKGNKKFFIPYSAEDFMGLIYPLLSKGKLGDSQMAWFKKNLLDPYSRAQENISTDRLQLMEDFKTLKKALDVPKDLRKKTDSGFTKEQAVRVYLFNKAGYDVPGISKTDLNELLDLVNSDGVLKAFADQIFNITKGDGYAKPSESWLVGTITTDLIDVLNTVKRAKYLEQSGFTANADLIFSKENLNKLEAAYGTKYREAMENILGRMKSGKNRLFSGNRLSNRVLDYINNSTGAIMFFNTRSAVLQTISSINFLNWSFNNPIKAGAAFANQKQYWKDFVELINSDYLVDRRNGLKLNINESEIADAAATSKNKARAAINYILQKGFLPTQYADSFAIASGGATFYRNRINDLVKNQGMSEADAKKQAMLEWRQTSEISQQSSDPSKISSQQASDLGRVILAFANTPMQYARIQKRALQDLINRRGDAKTHVSKIIYYAVVQNLIFNALQSALFKLGFDEEEDEKKEKMYLRTANGMLDSQLRGLGLAGATIAVIKNFLTDIYERSGRKRPEYVDSVYELLRVSPPISSKISKIRQAAYQFDSKKRRQEIFDKGFSIDNPAYEAGAKVISATSNIPLDRVYSKVDNISGAMSEDAETWQRIAMLAGWPKWNIMPDKQESSSFNKGNAVIKKRKSGRKSR